MEMPDLWCSDWPNVTCCNSCHDDFDEGYEQHFQGSLSDGRSYRVCCAVLHAINDGEQPKTATEAGQ